MRFSVQHVHRSPSKMDVASLLLVLSPDTSMAKHKHMAKRPGPVVVLACTGNRTNYKESASRMEQSAQKQDS